MASLRALCCEVTQHIGAPKPRSSHAMAIVGSNAYVFGGEFEPRVPIDNFLYVFDLETRTWSIAEAKGDIPMPRIGVTMVAVDEIIYVFAGRDKEHEERNEFYSFNTKTGVWKLLSSADMSPPHRSFHAMAADVNAKCVYIFGGCGKAGRLNDLWAFDIHKGEWHALDLPPPGSNCVPRGGPGLAVADGAVWVMCGFCGYELSDVHCYDLKSCKWKAIETLGEKPTGRSVFGTITVDKYVLLYGGEVDPSDQGHLGAGCFSGDIFVLDIKELTWLKLEVKVKGHHPGARGWYASAPFNDSLLIYGGNSESNDRLDDMYLLTLECGAEDSM